MKNNIVKVAFVAAIVMACEAYFMNSQRSETLSEIAMANVEALADKKPSSGTNCFWDSTDYLICDENGIWLACPCGCHKL